jgi:hypothetical protein
MKRKEGSAEKTQTIVYAEIPPGKFALVSGKTRKPVNPAPTLSLYEGP